MTTSSPKVLITGGQGQLAKAIVDHAMATGFKIAAAAKTQLDITQLPSIEKNINEFKPDFIINTAAYTAVDKAEQEIEKADAINFIGAKNLAIACQRYQIPLIHLSTDYVFNGRTTSPYQENDSTDPLNHYGLSKLRGEQAIRDIHDQHIILRLSGIYSSHGNNFVKTIIKLAKERPLLRIVQDQTTCPTAAFDIASALLEMIKHFSKTGTYHFCSRPATSWYDFTQLILREAKKYVSLQTQEIQPITSHEFNAPAKRPAYSELDCRRIASDYGVMQPDNALSVARVVRELLMLS